jgi:hypothetical protein
VFHGEAGLMESAVTRGRAADERVAQVATFTGSAFTIPEAAIPVFVFGAESVSLEARKAPGITENAPEAREHHQLLLNVMHWLTLADGMSD